MSLTSYRAAPPRARVLAVFRRIVSPWIRLVLASCGLAAGVCLAGAVVDPAYSGADRRLGVLRRGCMENGMPRGFKRMRAVSDGGGGSARVSGMGRIIVKRSCRLCVL